MLDTSESQVGAPAASCLLAQKFRGTEGQHYAQRPSMQQRAIVWNVGKTPARLLALPPKEWRPS